MASTVRHRDIELFLCAWFAEALTGRGEEYLADFVVDNMEPDPALPFPARLLVIRDDGMTSTGAVTGTTSIGMSVYAGTKRTPKDAKDAALTILALCSQIPSTDPDNPVAALLTTNGPFAVSEAQDRSKQYITLTLSVVGAPF